MESAPVLSASNSHVLDPERLIGHVGGQQPGMTLVFVGGIHGNEPSGVAALEQVLRVITSQEMPIRGNIYALAGNLTALNEGKRFHQRDLNRLWTPERMAILEQEGRPVDKGQDSQEQAELFKALTTIMDREKGPLMVIDLHTTSSDTCPFLAINDTMLNRRFASKFPIPIILGIEEYIEGPMLNYVSETGYPCVVFEAGQHDSPSSAENHRAFIWLCMAYTGMLSKEELPKFDRYFQRLKTATGLHQGFYDIHHREAITESEAFKMKRGFMNFQPIAEGQVLAENKLGEIHSPQRGAIFMPLYQSQGEDGFFIIRQVPRLALGLSAVLRWFHFDAWLALLPGVNRVEGRKHELRVNLSVARLLALELFHLLGYRKKRQEGRYLYFIRRAYDLRDRNGLTYKF